MRSKDAFPPYLKETCDNASYSGEQYRYYNEQKENEANKDSGDAPDTSYDSNDSKCFKITFRFKLPDSIQEISTSKEVYVIGIDPKGSDVALIMFNTNCCSYENTV